MCVVPFPVPGSASSGTVVLGSRTRTEQYVRWVWPLVGLWVGGFVVSVSTF
jgi:hypothetical protein